MSVESEIHRAVPAGTTLTTYRQGAQFVIAEYDADGLVLLLGTGRHRTRLPWACLEGIPAFLKGQGWVVAGGQFSTEDEADTLDEYLKRWLKRDVARWLVRVLDVAGLVEVDAGRPLHDRWVIEGELHRARAAARRRRPIGGRAPSRPRPSGVLASRLGSAPEPRYARASAQLSLERYRSSPAMFTIAAMLPCGAFSAVCLRISRNFV